MKDIQHLIRGGLLALLAIVGFTVVRNLMVPETFGKYGHYRAEAVIEEMAKDPGYQGAAACKKCHVKNYKEWDSGKHRPVNCENCHGSGKVHVKKPKPKSGTKTITIDRSKALCVRCHLKLPARPHDFTEIPHPQIDLEKHLKGKGKLKCFKCHNPHHPDVKRKEEKAVKEEKKEKAAKGKKVEKEAAAPVAKEAAKPAKKKVVAADNGVGRKVYQDTCLVCHGKDGKGKTETSEFLEPKPPDFSAASYKSSFSQIVNLTRKGKGEQMPAYGEELSEEEIQAVSRYIQGFKK